MAYKENYTQIPEAVSTENWRSKALCAGMGDVFFVPEEIKGKNRQRATEAAISICNQCPIKLKCLHTAIIEEKDNNIEHIFGVRGGTGPEDRKFFIRNYRKTGQLPKSSERTYTIK
jgi:hypothetical protein